MTGTPSGFQSPASTQTLAEGIAEYYAAHPELKRGDGLSPEARDFFRCHDVVHVIYGCGTTMPDEAIVKLSSMLGTTGGFGVLHGYRLHDSFDIYRRLPLGSTLLALLGAPYLIARTLWRCTGQIEKWPWSDHGALMQTPLRDLRAQFGIRVAHGSASRAP